MPLPAAAVRAPSRDDALVQPLAARAFWLPELLVVDPEW